MEINNLKPYEVLDGIKLLRDVLNKYNQFEVEDIDTYMEIYDMLIELDDILRIVYLKSE